MCKVLQTLQDLTPWYGLAVSDRTSLNTRTARLPCLAQGCLSNRSSSSGRLMQLQQDPQMACQLSAFLHDTRLTAKTYRNRLDYAPCLSLPYKECLLKLAHLLPSSSILLCCPAARVEFVKHGQATIAETACSVLLGKAIACLAITHALRGTKVAKSWHVSTRQCCSGAANMTCLWDSTNAIYTEDTKVGWEVGVLLHQSWLRGWSVLPGSWLVTRMASSSENEQGSQQTLVC